MHRCIDISNINKDRLKMERLPLQEVVNQEPRLSKGPTAGIIYPAQQRWCGTGAESPRIAARGDQDQGHPVTLLKDYHQFLVRWGAMILTLPKHTHTHTRPPYYIPPNYFLQIRIVKYIWFKKQETKWGPRSLVHTAHTNLNQTHLEYFWILWKEVFFLVLLWGFAFFERIMNKVNAKWRYDQDTNRK